MSEHADNHLFPDRLLEEIRDRFYYVDSDPISGERVWLESASGALRLKAAVDALARQTAYPDQLGRANPSSQYAGELMARGMEDVRVFLGAVDGAIVPAMSSTHAAFRVVNAALSSLPGTNVVTTDLEHPCVYDSTWQFASAYGKEWRVAHVDPTTGSVPAEVILEKVDRNTTLVGLIHGANMTGAVLDVETVAREARRINPEVVVLADGVQYAPHAPVDVRRLGVDAYVFGPYKAFCVKGIGFAWVSERLAALPHWKLRGTAAGSWTLGSPEDPTYAAWTAVVDYLCWLGSHFTSKPERRAQVVAAMEASQRHLESLLRLVLHGSGRRSGLTAMDHVSIQAFQESPGRLCLLLFNLKGVDSATSVELFNRRRIRLHNRTRDAYSKHTLDALGLEDGVRLSACHYNSPQDIERFLEVAELLADPAERGGGPDRRTARAGPGEG